MTNDEARQLIDELIVETHGKLDGGRKNIICDCPWCGKHQKYGIYVKPTVGRKVQFASHCFSCGRSTHTIEELLNLWDRPDLIPNKQVQTTLENWESGSEIEEEEIDDSLVEIEMPGGYKRTTKNMYLKKRGFTKKDFDYFPVGTTRGLNFKFDDYVIFEIIESGVKVGYVSRHTWSKKEIEEYNQRQALVGGFQIRRYNNSYGEEFNDFSKLLYNYDNVIKDETDTVIICEGCFDVIALTRHLNLYNNHRIAAVATFGKQISEAQAFKLQDKGVRTIVIGYDADAEGGIIKAANDLEQFFDVYIAKLDGDGKDWDEIKDWWQVYDAFSCNLLTPFEYKHLL